MPYKLKAVGTGYKVVNTKTGKEHSLTPIPKVRAESQLRLLTALEKGNFTPRK